MKVNTKDKYIVTVRKCLLAACRAMTVPFIKHLESKQTDCINNSVYYSKY